MEIPKGLFTEAERQRDRAELLVTRALVEARLAEVDAQLERLDTRSATVEEWELRYKPSIDDPKGRLEERFDYREDAAASATRANEGACFGTWGVIPRLVGEVAVASSGL